MAGYTPIKKQEITRVPYAKPKQTENKSNEVVTKTSKPASPIQPRS